jgi:hypothetical protein
MTEKELQVRLRLKNDLPHFAYKCLQIRTKPGEVVNLAFNTAQLYLHSQIEEQRKKTGRVRVIVLKGRQQGVSTYVSSRFYHIVSHRTGHRAFILTHQQPATDNLFAMVKRYHTYCPVVVRPIDDRNNTKELNFISPEASGYKVGTAGSKGIGRSDTIQLFHGSEVAFWENASDHLDGIMQAVPRMDKTEIIFESTANGKGNVFYNLWKEAIDGKNEFLPVFIPWFWTPEYVAPVPEDFILSDEEEELRQVYNLSKEQLSWRRIAVNSSQLKELGFKQEYPCNAEEAFIVTGGDAYISSIMVQKARKCQAKAVGIKFIGVDPARGGADRTSIIFRQGRVAYGLRSYHVDDTMLIVGDIVQMIKTHNPDYVCIDVIGIGSGIVDRLRELGYGEMIRAINAAHTALNHDRYANKRAEMWGVMAEWLQDEPVSIPDSDSLHSDLCAPFYKWDSKGRLLLEKKEDMKRRRVKSPDEADALALTFAFPSSRNNANIGNIFTPNISI